MKKTPFIKLLIYVLSLLMAIALIFTALFFSNSKKLKGKKTDRENGQLILGFSQIGSESAWRTRNTESIFEAAAQNNIQILFNDAQQKQENQLKAIRSFIVYQVDVIAFVPIVEDGWDNVLQEAKDANIPVIVVDRQINVDPSMYAGFLGENGFEEGQAAGIFLTEKCHNNPSKKINILELTGTENSSIAINRAQGFRSVISKDPRFNIIHSEDGDFLRSRGKEIIDRIVEENGGLRYNNEPIDVVFSHNDPMTLGMLDSLNSKNISHRNTIIITIDAEQEAINALVDGQINCVVECNPNLGPALMNLVTKIAMGQSIPAKTYMVETVFKETDDFSKYVPRGY